MNQPILVSVSNESFSGKILTKQCWSDLLAGTLVTEVVSILNGADIIRTHHVGKTKEVSTITQKLS